jgi:hypothetical protein
VQFTILGVAGLTTSTQVSNITLGVGTSGSSITPATLVCTGTCDGTITSLNVQTPEPLTFLLAGGALFAIGSFRKRFALTGDLLESRSSDSASPVSGAKFDGLE